MTTHIKWTFFILAIFMIGCSPKTNESIQNEPEPAVEESVVTSIDTTAQDTIPEKEPEMVLKISKTPCFGKCPVFSAEVYDNGEIIYVGERFTKIKGEQFGRIPEEQVEEMLRRAKFIRFNELNEQYPGPDDPKISDLPTTITTIVLDGNRKTVRNTHDAPKRLIDLENYLIDVIDAVEYSPERSETQDKDMQ